MDQSARLFVSALFAGGALSSLASAATITEYFNDYGTTSRTLLGLNGGTGFSSDFVKAASVTDNAQLPTYAAGSVTYASPNYSNAGNQSGADDGYAAPGTSNAGVTTGRSFDGLTGTVWISVLNRFTANNGDFVLGLDSPTANNTNFIALRARDAVIRTGGTTDTDEFGAAVADRVYAANTTYLMLARIQIDVSGTSDQIDYWVFDNSAASADIGDVPATAAELAGVTPSFTKTGDFYGNSLTGVNFGMLGGGGSMVDALRISNDADGFAQVTSVPEPAALAAAGLATAGLLRRRRR